MIYNNVEFLGARSSIPTTNCLDPSSASSQQLYDNIYFTSVVLFYTFKQNNQLLTVITLLSFHDCAIICQVAYTTTMLTAFNLTQFTDELSDKLQLIVGH